VAKHADSTNVRLELLQNEKYIQLTIADNGIGFNASKTYKGIGLANIKNRSLTYNGIADITSKPGQGCLLTATFPVSAVALHKRPVAELKDNKKSLLVEKIKEVIIEHVHYSNEQLKTNLSVHLSNKLEYDYTYLSNIFSEIEGVTIQKFIMAQKIERVKELLTFDELTLTQIARKLHYSSTAHLSNQFKKVTGLSPSFFKQ
jgi:YesN/AraC family two-component response regulator